MTVTPLRTMGGTRSNELFLEDVRIPRSALLGHELGEHRGWHLFRQCQYSEWDKGPGAYVGLLRRALDALVVLRPPA